VRAAGSQTAGWDDTMDVRMKQDILYLFTGLRAL